MSITNGAWETSLLGIWEGTKVGVGSTVGEKGAGLVMGNLASPDVGLTVVRTLIGEIEGCWVDWDVGDLVGGLVGIGLSVGSLVGLLVWGRVGRLVG